MVYRCTHSYKVHIYQLAVYAPLTYALICGPKAFLIICSLIARCSVSIITGPIPMVFGRMNSYKVHIYQLAVYAPLTYALICGPKSFFMVLVVAVRVVVYKGLSIG